VKDFPQRLESLVGVGLGQTAVVSRVPTRARRDSLLFGASRELVFATRTLRESLKTEGISGRFVTSAGSSRCNRAVNRVLHCAVRAGSNHRVFVRYV
jgi:hypothetical protein